MRLLPYVSIPFKTALACFAVIYIPASIHAQDSLIINGHGCGMHGSAKAKEEYAQNPFKNRYNPPKKEDFSKAITLQKLIAGGKDSARFSQDSAVEITGYVFDVKSGGKETCNCRSDDTLFWDTHIELTPSATETTPDKRLIVEVTPRWREKSDSLKTGWSTKSLKRSIMHHTITVKGWLFYDAFHKDDSSSYDPEDKIDTGPHHNIKNWRATCWEVHPITKITVLH